MSWEVLFHKRVLKETKHLPSEIATKLKKAVAILGETPHPHTSKKLVNVTPDTWRLRIANWRITYQINKSTKTIIITHILHRREIYRKK